MKQTFGMADADFAAPCRTGEAPLPPELPGGLDPATADAFRALLGDGGVATDAYARLRAAYGKTMLDLMRLREGLAENPPDAVLYPRNRHDVARIVAL